MTVDNGISIALAFLAIAIIIAGRKDLKLATELELEAKKIRQYVIITRYDQNRIEDLETKALDIQLRVQWLPILLIVLAVLISIF